MATVAGICRDLHDCLLWEQVATRSAKQSSPAKAKGRGGGEGAAVNAMICLTARSEAGQGEDKEAGRATT